MDSIGTVVGNVLISAIDDAIAAALTEAGSATTYTVREGWPDAMAPLPDGVLVCVTISEVVEAATPPGVWSNTRVGDDVTTAYVTATWTTNAQVDVFAPVKAQRDAFAAVVRSVFSQPPDAGGAAFVLSGYGDTVAYAKVTGQSNADPSSVIGGRWRNLFEVQIRGAILNTATLPALRTADLDINGVVTSIQE